MRKPIYLLGLAVFFCLAIVAFAAFRAPRFLFHRDGTASMVRRLEAIADDKPGLFQWFTIPDQIASVRRRLQNPTDLPKETELRVLLGRDLVSVGQNRDGIEEFRKVQSIFERIGTTPDSKPFLELRKWLGVAYLRLGEQENCLQNHSADSCLMPIQGGGIYSLRDGPHGAVEQYTAILAAIPNDLNARWLLNLAHMTFGDWPAGVPEAYRIPPEAFASEFDIGRFPEVASAVGLDKVGISGGSIMEDFDRDGFLDVITSSCGIRDQLRYFHNNGDGTFADRTEQAGLTGEFGGLNINHADYNNDGWPDVFVLRGAWMGRRGEHPNSLLRNNGDGTFTDVTEEAGLLSLYPTQTAVWADFDNDGWLDLYIGAESYREYRHPCELYHNNRDGTFTEIAEQAGVARVAFVKGVTAGDYDNDGRPDLYLSVQHGPNVLFHNDGPAGGVAVRFSDATGKAGVAEPEESFPTWFFDYDNDGWLDLFVCGFTGYQVDSLECVVADYLKLPKTMDTPRLYHNNHDGTFTDVTQEAHLDREILGMAGNFGDLDNDGWLDFYIGTGKPHLWTLIPNRMFRNAGGKLFQDVTTSGGFGHLQKGHGIAWGDLDNDGDQDIYETLGGILPSDVYQNVLFLNPGHANHWTTLELEGVKSNRFAVGARIKIVTEEEDGSERAIYDTVGTGGSFGSSSLQQEMGLGRAKAIRRIEITWPVTGAVQVIADVPFDRTVKIREGDAGFVEVPRKTLVFPTGSPAGHHHHQPNETAPATS